MRGSPLVQLVRFPLRPTHPFIRTPRATVRLTTRHPERRPPPCAVERSSAKGSGAGAGPNAWIIRLSGALQVIGRETLLPHSHDRPF